jgi:hypothetical protein
MATFGVVVISLEGMKYLSQCLESARWADAVAVLHVGEGEPAVGEKLPSFASLRRAGSVEEAIGTGEKIGTDWILHLWGEERVEPELKEELDAIRRAERAQVPSAFRIPVRSRLLDRWVEGSLMGPSPALRLSRKGKEVPLSWWNISAGKAPEAAGLLEGSISDYASAELSDGIHRIQRVSSLWAGHPGAGKSDPGSFRITLRALRVLMRLLFLNRLFSRGLAGLTLSVLAAYGVLLSGAKAWEARNTRQHEKGKR